MGVGQDLLDVPFPQMVMNLAYAIARGQLALDRTSLATARMLATEKVELIQEMTEVITPVPRVVEVLVYGKDGKPIADSTEKDGWKKDRIPVTGAKIEVTNTPPVEFTLMQAGLMPTFYQFTESIIEVKMAISQKSTSSKEFEAGASFEASAKWGWGSASFASHVNYKTANTYSYSAEGSSLLRTTIKPVPPPSRLMPRIVQVNCLTDPPTVTVS
jgi:hypothetical protein